MTLHTVSYGGGVQATALLALAALGRIPHPGVDATDDDDEDWTR